jgi:hypothetical protein
MSFKRWAPFLAFLLTVLPHPAIAQEGDGEKYDKRIWMGEVLEEMASMDSGIYYLKDAVIYDGLGSDQSPDEVLGYYG